MVIDSDAMSRKIRLSDRQNSGGSVALSESGSARDPDAYSGETSSVGGKQKKPLHERIARAVRGSGEDDIFNDNAGQGVEINVEFTSQERFVIDATPKKVCEWIHPVVSLLCASKRELFSLLLAQLSLAFVKVYSSNLGPFVGRECTRVLEDTSDHTASVWPSRSRHIEYSSPCACAQSLPGASTHTSPHSHAPRPTRQVTIEDLKGSQRMLDALWEFSREEHTEENLEFMRDVLRFKKGPTVAAQRDIIDKYLAVWCGQCLLVSCRLCLPVCTVCTQLRRRSSASASRYDVRICL